MDERRGIRFFNRENELHRTAVGRALWRRVGAARNDARMAPRSYETSRNIQKGYESDEQGDNLKT